VAVVNLKQVYMSVLAFIPRVASFIPRVASFIPRFEALEGIVLLGVILASTIATASVVAVVRSSK
jgi:hypothetical protein